MIQPGTNRRRATAERIPLGQEESGIGRRSAADPQGLKQSAYVVHTVIPSERGAGRSADHALAEAMGLAAAIGISVAGGSILVLKRPRPSTLLGAGQLSELEILVKAQGIDLVIFNAALTPVQQRNLERALSCKVIDRTGLILEIFGARARTKEGQLQVELAALTYQRSRLVRSWTHLERQRGGFGFLGGPGESQLEIDRRLISERIARIKKDLEQVKRTRSLHRQARERVPYATIALVGYTNAGKSTLFNRLTGAKVFAKDLLFATLDPTMRQIDLPSGRKAILSDTVGFISDLPTHLIAAFRATLEEVRAADLILHVRDVSSDDESAQAADVLKVLKGIEIEQALEDSIVDVLNKTDLLAPEEQERLKNRARRSGAVVVSALSGDGIDDLLACIDERLAGHRRIFDVALAHDQGAALAWLYRHGEVLAREDGEEKLMLQVALSGEMLDRFSAEFRGPSSKVEIARGSLSAVQETETHEA